MTKVVVVGGGLAGCAAAIAAAKAGASVTLLERMEVLGGCALLAGMVHHEDFSIMEELRLMDGYDIFQVFDDCTLHENVKWPWPKPIGTTTTIHDVTKLDSELRKHLAEIGVEVRLVSRAKDVEMDGKVIRAVILDDKSKVQCDVFIDAT